MRGNPQALFGKRPTEKDPAKGTSPAVDFTRREAARKRPGFTRSERGTSLGGRPYPQLASSTALTLPQTISIGLRSCEWPGSRPATSQLPWPAPGLGCPKRTGVSARRPGRGGASHRGVPCGRLRRHAPAAGVCQLRGWPDRPLTASGPTYATTADETDPHSTNSRTSARKGRGQRISNFGTNAF